jgi:16S rRNA (uracil1498-N3)-methyltransferase
LQRITITTHQIQANQLNLTSEQQHYLSRVLRLNTGEQFQAIDGQGAIYLATLQTHGASIIEQSNILSRELPIAVHLVLAIPKHGLDDLVRACTELGVTAIYPITSDRTIPKPSSSKQQRWQKIAQEAAEQCERLIIPVIHDLQPWPQIFPPSTDRKFICEARATTPHLLQSNISAIPLWIAIGPEGGWTDRELTQSIDRGWQAVSLGSRILRTITAPIVAMSIVGSILESDPAILPTKHP